MRLRGSPAFAGSVKAFANCCSQVNKGYFFRADFMQPLERWRRFQNRIYSRVMSNIVSGRQIRAGRMLAGLTQAGLARAAGCHPRSVRYWENKGSNPPTNVASTLDSIEQALYRHGVIPFSTPTPGVRCSN